ncbi:MAG: YbaK/EbsC family protein [Actinomycetota bacterium]
MIEALEALGADYEVLPCDPDLADTNAFCAAYGIPLERSANTIVVASRRPEGKHVACLVLATTRLDVNGVVRRRLGVKKASFARPSETMSLTGMAIGGVTPFGLDDGLPVWVDSRVMEPDWVIIGAGTREAKVRIAPALLERLSNTEVVSDLAQVPGSSGPAEGAPE